MKAREERQKPDDASGRQDPSHQGGPTAEPPMPGPAAKAGLAREVGDIEDPDAEEQGALPGRAGGGLAGG